MVGVNIIDEEKRDLIHSLIDEFAERLLEYKWTENGVTEIIKARKVIEIANQMKREIMK